MIAWLLLLNSLVADGECPPGTSVSGSVGDVRGAIVTATHQKTGAIVRTTAGRLGEYALFNLDKGGWWISAEATGYRVDPLSPGWFVEIGPGQTCHTVHIRMQELTLRIRVEEIADMLAVLQAQWTRRWNAIR